MVLLYEGPSLLRCYQAQVPECYLNSHTNRVAFSSTKLPLPHILSVAILLYSFRIFSYIDALHTFHDFNYIAPLPDFFEKGLHKINGKSAEISGKNDDKLQI